MKILWGTIKVFSTTCPRRLLLHYILNSHEFSLLAVDLSQGCSWILQSPWRRGVTSPWWLSDVPNTVLDVSSGWIIRLRVWSPWVSGSCLWVWEAERRCEASLTNFISVFLLGRRLLRLLPGAVNLVVACGLYTAERCISTRQAAFTSAFANDCFCACALAHEMRLRRRVRALAFGQLWGLALTGALSSDSLFRVSIKTNERTIK
jgi:hypothetical protein